MGDSGFHCLNKEDICSIVNSSCKKMKEDYSCNVCPIYEGREISRSTRRIYESSRSEE